MAGQGVYAVRIFLSPMHVSYERLISTEPSTHMVADGGGIEYRPEHTGVLSDAETFPLEPAAVTWPYPLGLSSATGLPPREDVRGKRENRGGGGLSASPLLVSFSTLTGERVRPASRGGLREIEPQVMSAATDVFGSGPSRTPLPVDSGESGVMGRVYDYGSTEGEIKILDFTTLMVAFDTRGGGPGIDRRARPGSAISDTRASGVHDVWPYPLGLASPSSSQRFEVSLGLTALEVTFDMRGRGVDSIGDEGGGRSEAATEEVGRDVWIVLDDDFVSFSGGLGEGGWAPSATWFDQQVARNSDVYESRPATSGTAFHADESQQSTPPQSAQTSPPHQFEVRVPMRLSFTELFTAFAVGGCQVLAQDGPPSSTPRGELVDAAFQFFDEDSTLAMTPMFVAYSHELVDHALASEIDRFREAQSPHP